MTGAGARGPSRAPALLLALAAVLLAPSAARAAKAVFVVRHAEKQAPDSSAPEVPLSQAGTDRANRLAALLRDAGVNAIYATDTVRARDTAAPLARSAAQTIRTYSAVPALAGELRADPNAIALVVGHSNTVPALLAALGVQEKVSLADADYDNLFVVVPAAAADPVLVRLKY